MKGQWQLLAATVFCVVLTFEEFIRRNVQSVPVHFAIYYSSGSRFDFTHIRFVAKDL
jgi:hypothetical protein